MNANKTDVELLWFTAEQKREYARAVIHAALWQFKGQWIYDLDAGIDYLAEAFENNPSIETLANLYRIVLAGIDLVQAVISLDVAFDRDAETLRIDWVVLVGGELVSGKTGLDPLLYPFVFSDEFGPEFG